MIDRVVQRPFLFWQAEAMADAKPEEPDHPLPEEEAPPTPEEIAEAQQAVQAGIAREREQPLTFPEEEAEQRGEEGLPLEHFSYFPRDAALSLVQSAVEQYLFEFASPEMISRLNAEGETLRDDEPASAVADFKLEIPDDAIPPEGDDERRLGGAFEITDPRWISSVVAMGWRKLKGKKDFPENAAPPHSLSDDARVVVVGDWASGNLRARRVAAEMRKAVEAAREAGRQCHVVHLGDTYYGGWGYEYKKRFLPHWPVDPGEKDEVGSWSLPGNHDMYTGGHGYYGVLLEDERFKPYHRGSSWFSLENDHWQLLGLDSSWQDHALEGDQAAWVQRKVAEEPGRRTMLMTHHQPFSAYAGDGPRLRGPLKSVLDNGGIDAWLWGHEHRCAIYEEGRGIPNPRLIGHGGVPVYAPGPKPSEVRWHLDRTFRVGLESWAFCGFAVFDFDGPSISVAYVNEFGETDKDEQI